MSFGAILYDIIVLPIETIIEFIFCFVLDKFGKFGVAGAIVAVSLAVNFLALPIYNVADDIQIKERELQKKMKRWVSHIKAHFKGDEQFMMLSEYYRQNNYHPLYALRQSLSILIQIPFFMAAYNFLSHCYLLENQSILLLKDLSKPDALVKIGDFVLNLLPILMTAINIVSAIIYAKDAPLREKMQSFVLAGIFLVLLYNSPSGLVFYWVLNQIFSLCKNIVKKLPRPKWIVYGFFSALLLAICAYFVLFKDNKLSLTKCCFYLLTLIFVSAPFVWNFLKSKKLFKRIAIADFAISNKQNFVLLFVSCISLCVLCGLLLPSSVIATSPVEFSFLGDIDSPLSYIWLSFAFFAGFFVFWPICIYKMFSDNKNVKNFMPPLFFVLAMSALANAFLFKYDYGTLDVDFCLDNIKVLENHSLFYICLPLFFYFLILIIWLVLNKKNKGHFIAFFILSVVVGQIWISFSKMKKIDSIYVSYNKDRKEKEKRFVPDFHLSKTEKNVIVLFLDRAISSFFPYIIEQFPDLNESYDGFVYYPNCLSFADFTNCGAPAMMGGYDYTIDEINKRSDELLKDKHNESILVLPKIFDEAGYETTIYNAPYIDYNSGFIPESFAFTNVKTTDWKLIREYKRKLNEESSDQSILSNKALKHFTVMQILYPLFRKKFSKDTVYYFSRGKTIPINYAFLKSYAQLFYLGNATAFDSEKPTYTFIGNDTTHEYTRLLSPDYTPGEIDDNHPAAGTGSYPYTNDYDFTAYHSNVAAHLQVAKFLKRLKEESVYDNTRIIIVADHGRDIPLPIFKNFENAFDAAFLNPLLLFKDFNSHGMPITDSSLKTNAETVYLATKELCVSDKNPFTGNKIRSAQDFDSFNVYGIREWRVSEYEGKTQFPLNLKDGYVYGGSSAYTVRDNIFDEKNWTKINIEEAVK